jgi:hypothetical protein
LDIYIHSELGQSRCLSSFMTSNFDFTNKAEQSIADAIQLAKDYANAQCHLLFPISRSFVHQLTLFLFSSAPCSSCLRSSQRWRRCIHPVYQLGLVLHFRHSESRR